MTWYRRALLVAIQIPLIALWTVALLVARSGDEGTLHNGFLRSSIYPAVRRMEGAYTDLKFHARGAVPVRNKIVIVEIDDKAVEQIARWPWHRDAVAILLYSALEAGAKVVGLDIVFSEPDQRVSDDLAAYLKEHQLDDQIPAYETDLKLQRIIAVYRDRLVLGWMSDNMCRPAFETATACPVTDPDELAAIPPGFDKFAIASFAPGKGFAPARTPLVSASSLVINLPAYVEAGAHSGFLSNAAEDSDDVVRRTQLALLVDGRAYPSLPLEMARVGLGREIDLGLDGDGFVDHLALGKRMLPVDRGGTLAINFRGGGYHFRFVGAVDLIDDSKDVIPVQHDGIVENLPRTEIFKDAYVLIGVTALGARDLRHFPFGSNIPGTEGLANVLDNILTGDALETTAPAFGHVMLLLVMTVGGLLFGMLMLRLPALPAMFTSLGIIGLLAGLDVWWMFGQLAVDLRSVFLFAELATIFLVTLAVKYLLEERGKRFIRSTFSKYLAPAVVDQMLADPTKLQLGGETRRLTIMMSDLRGFTAMAERLKPAEVLTVLNHYLGTMADIIMEYGGTIDEFIGDAILVIFGAPIEGKDDARRAVACAVAMQRAMKAINEHNVKLGLPKLEMGIALNTGEVIVGNIGSQKHIKYGVVGSHVNLTARIESNTVGGQVLISGSTLDLAGEHVKVGEKQMIIAKGFPDPIPAFEIKGIGGEYDLAIEEVDLGLVELATPIEIRYRIMKGKNEEGDEQVARLTSISPLGASLAGDGALETFANLKIRVADVEGDLYAKVIGPGRLRFTAVPPAVEKLITARSAA